MGAIKSNPNAPVQLYARDTCLLLLLLLNCSNCAGSRWRRKGKTCWVRFFLPHRPNKMVASFFFFWFYCTIAASQSLLRLSIIKRRVSRFIWEAQHGQEISAPIVLLTPAALSSATCSVKFLAFHQIAHLHIDLTRYLLCYYFLFKKKVGKTLLKSIVEIGQIGSRTTKFENRSVIYRFIDICV